MEADAPEHFVCAAAACAPTAEAAGVLLVSSPGFAILDSGCEKTIVGARTLDSFKKISKQHDVHVHREPTEQNRFRYGNGEQEVSNKVIEMPVLGWTSWLCPGRSGSGR